MSEAIAPRPSMESFRGVLLRHRGRTGLTQGQLANRIGVARRTIQDWESGVNFPTAGRLQAVIGAFLAAGGLSGGQEAAEAEALWSSAERESSRMHAPFDSTWFTQVLDQRATPAAVLSAQPGQTRQDWGEAPDTAGFIGRAEELAVLREAVVDKRRRLVAFLGMGGIGKTTLAAKVAQEVAASFECVYWRSLRNAPPPDEWLARAIGFASDQQLVPPPSESERLSALLRLLRERRCLIVLDNAEALLEPGQHGGRYRAGMDGYGRLLEAVAVASHQSCLMLTSREVPPEIPAVLGDAVRSFLVGGLGVDDAQVLVASKNLAGTAQHWAELNARLGGNGLALKVVGETIRELFDGDIRAFLVEAGASSIFGGIRRLLAEQIERSSALEQRGLRALAVEREPVTAAALVAVLGERVGRGAVLEAIEALLRRSLVERSETPGPAAFTLQSVVLEYVIDRLVDDVSDEIARGEPVLLVEQPLIKSQAKDYVRQSQERLVGGPILQQLKARLGDADIEQRLLRLLEGWRGRPDTEQGYGPGNVVNLLRLLRGGLCGLDLSHLAIRQAYLADVDARNASLMGANFAAAVLADAFDFPGKVALSHDGALLTVGTSTGQVCLWRSADRAPQWAVQGHTGGVTSVAHSTDGRIIASSGGDGLVRLWEAATGRPLAVVEGHGATVGGVALSADGSLVAAGDTDGMVRLWDASTGRLLATLSGHTGAVWRVALSADGGLVTSAGDDGNVRLWQAAFARDDGIAKGAEHALTPARTWRPLKTLRSHGGAVWRVALSADGDLVASGGDDGTVRLWESATGQPVATLEAHAGAVWGLALSADGRVLASGGEDGIVRVWEEGSTRTEDTGHASEWRALAALPGHTVALSGVALSADGGLVACSGNNGTVRLWEAKTGQPFATMPGQTGGVWGVALSADGHTVASGSYDGVVRLWDTTGGRVLGALQAHAGAVWRVALSADGHLLASGGMDGAVRLWDTRTGHQLSALLGHAGRVWGVAQSADGHFVASGGDDATVRLWDAATGQLLATLEGHTGAVWRVAISADGQLVASGGSDGTVRVWNARTARLMTGFPGHAGAVWAVAMSADGRLVASAGEDGTSRLWDTGTGRAIAILQGHAGAVWGASLSADGELIASGGTDGTVRLWDTSTGCARATLLGHTGAVSAVSLSADGRLVASGSFDGTVRIWDAQSGTCVKALRAERRYERLDITGLTGISNAQRHALLALGAVDRTDSPAIGVALRHGHSSSSESLPTECDPKGPDARQSGALSVVPTDAPRTTLGGI